VKEEGIVETIRGWVSGMLGGNLDAAAIEPEMDRFAEGLLADAAEMISGWPNDEFTSKFSQEESGLAAYCAARVLKAAGRAGAAINMLESALRQHIESAEMYLLLGDLYCEKDFPVRAVQYYGKARELGAGMEPVKNRWLSCLRESGDWRTIIAEIEAIEPTADTGFLMLKAQALHGSGNSGEALRLLENLMAREDISASEMAGSAILSGKIREDKGDILGAIDFYEKSFDMNPDNPQAHFELGRLYFKHNAVPLAKNQMMSLLKKFPESDWADKARKLMAQEGVL
jgi:tetratricopeptide (TPR) repeat protein